MSIYLVTGGAGFIGSHIVKHLVGRDERVRVVDNFLTGSQDNLSDVINAIDLVEGDIRDEELMRKVTRGVDCCLHQAALSSVPRSVEDPLTSNDINVNGTLNVLLSARDAEVKRFVFASSSSVYGDSPALPKREDMPLLPLSPYAISKLSGELYARAFRSLYGMPTVCLRYFNVFGPGQNPDSPYAAVIPIFIAAMAEGRPATVHGDGEQSRDFCYVDNVVAANVLACSVPADRVAGRVFNIACEERHTINELVRSLNGILGKNVRPVYIAARSGDVKHSLADITLAKNHLGYESLVDFNEGLKRTIDWFQSKDSRVVR